LVDVNEWIKKSIDLTNGPGYLDALSKAYPVNKNPERQISKEIETKLKKLFDNREKNELIKELLSMEKFPIKNPYVAHLGADKEAIKKNPGIVDNICETLFDIGFEKMMEGIKEPKENNRQMGPLFQKYSEKIGFQFMEENEFRINETGIVILKGTDSSLAKFAGDELEYDIDKGLDIIAKVNKTYVIGEAKFLTDNGGHQNAQFKDAMTLIDNYNGPAIPIAILDGVVWITSKNKMHKTVLNQKNIVLSALLIRKFLESLL
jgi:hypothetical protein